VNDIADRADVDPSTFYRHFGSKEAVVFSDLGDWTAHLGDAVRKRPTMVFRSTRVTGAGSEYRVDGELTIGEVTRPTVLAVEFGGIETFPGGPRHAGFEATMEVRRKDFGIDVQLPPGVSAVMLGEVVKVQLDLVLLEPVI
jgi:polyisoprenoid-binding protein YceI